MLHKHNAQVIQVHISVDLILPPPGVPTHKPANPNNNIEQRTNIGVEGWIKRVFMKRFSDDMTKNNIVLIYWNTLEYHNIEVNVKAQQLHVQFWYPQLEK